MSKVRKTSFQKGVSGNPAGKPKGTYSPLRKQLMVLKNLAAEKAEEAFNDLWKDFKAGDPLAKQIYFKDLVSVPKEWLSEINTADIPKEIKNPEDLNKCMTAITEILIGADFMSSDEAHNLVKILNNIKFTEKIVEQATPVKETRESLMEKIYAIQRVIDYAKSEEKE